LNYANTDISLARELDAQDELAYFRDEFVIDEPNLIYLDGNSLGRLPKRTVHFMRNMIEHDLLGWEPKLPSWLGHERMKFLSQKGPLSISSS
jgi:kynureninase